MGDLKLYFKGLLARVIQVIGGMFLFAGIFSILIFSMFNHNKIWIGALICVLGGLILVWGNALRFKFKRKSGYLIYND